MRVGHAPMSGEQMNQSIPMARVVVIDDEHIVADTLVQILIMHGYKAKAYYSGQTALEDAREFRPEVVLSDVQMQPIDGIEATIRIRELLPDCRMILFTASPVRAEIHQRISKLGFEFLERPLHPAEVLALLEKGTTWQRVASLTRCPAAQHGR